MGPRSRWSYAFLGRSRSPARTGRSTCVCRKASAAARGVDARSWSSVLHRCARRRGLGPKPARVGPKAVAGLRVSASQGAAAQRSARHEPARIRASPGARVTRCRSVRTSSDDAVEATTQGNPALALSQVERALALWRGPAYADVMYEDFARSEAERLEEMRLAALELRLEALTLGSFHFGPATADRNR